MKNGKLYVCGSDGRIYIYGNKEDFQASKKLEELRGSMSKPLKDQEFVSGGQRFKVTNGEVYQFINGEWIYVGKGEGIKPYDNTFQVELDGRYYTLSFNNNENVYDVAEQFLRKNKLRDEFKDDIVEFIKQNFTRADDFKVNREVNGEGVRSMLMSDTIGGNRVRKYPCILKNLDSPNILDNEGVEKELEYIMKNGPTFVGLDLLRYFSSWKYVFNFSFLAKFIPQNKKEGIAFVGLVTNLLSRPPFNLEILHRRISELKDQGIIGEKVWDDYLTNRELRNRNKN
jgi:phospholipase A-2-activating protein